jgi:hypothetical protein
MAVGLSLLLNGLGAMSSFGMGLGGGIGYGAGHRIGFEQIGPAIISGNYKPIYGMVQNFNKHMNETLGSLDLANSFFENFSDNKTPEPVNPFVPTSSDNQNIPIPPEPVDIPQLVDPVIELHYTFYNPIVNKNVTHTARRTKQGHRDTIRDLRTQPKSYNAKLNTATKLQIEAYTESYRRHFKENP